MSFSAYRKELTSRRFKKAYNLLREDCPGLSSFVDHGDLIAFFHDRTADPDRKDAILFELITHYRENEYHLAIAPLFLVLFTPAMANIYSYARRKHPAIDRDDLVQDLSMMLLQIIGEVDISPHKVAGRIIGELRNRVRDFRKRIPDVEFVPLKGDGTDEFEANHADATSDVIFGSDAVSDAAVDINRIMADISAFLNRLIRARKISRNDKRILLKTLLGGESLKDLAPPRDYVRLKHRLQQVMAFIRNYSANS
ncbi:MAG: hypothetical protein JXA41_12900 [Deltaproteobacteria bacterium]|nr:hypothetical protein [Deltaproteobacteria bacterium]